MGVNMRQKVRWATHLSHEVLVCSEPPTHAPDDTWHDLFGIRHRFVGRHMIGQMVFVHISDGQQKGARPVPAPSQLLHCTSRTLSPSSSRAHSFRL